MPVFAHPASFPVALSFTTGSTSSAALIKVYDAHGLVRAPTGAGRHPHSATDGVLGGNGHAPAVPAERTTRDNSGAAVCTAKAD
ncbi:hypothetical protein [Streptomyces sp. NPDC058755]|uniref:hypothetical protein n=1 Tax=Streptomyces sp. NPDC058755 TaxID=3346624 RepID=UPI0036B4CEB1